MGLIRKMASASTLGGVKYTSRREAQTKAALEEAKLAKAQRRALEDEGQAEQAEAAQDRPWYAQKSAGGAISAALRARKGRGQQAPEA